MTPAKILIKILMPAISILTPACEVVTRKLSESLDHPPNYYDRIRVRLHLLICDFCARYQKQIILLRKFLETHQQDILEFQEGPGLSDEARNRIIQKLHDNGSHEANR